MKFAEREPELAAQITDSLAYSNAFVLDMNGALFSQKLSELVEEAVKQGATSVFIKNIVQGESCE